MILRRFRQKLANYCFSMLYEFVNQSLKLFKIFEDAKRVPWFFAQHIPWWMPQLVVNLWDFEFGVESVHTLRNRESLISRVLRKHTPGLGRSRMFMCTVWSSASILQWLPSSSKRVSYMPGMPPPTPTHPHHPTYTHPHSVPTEYTAPNTRIVPTSNLAIHYFVLGSKSLCFLLHATRHYVSI